MNSKDQTVKSMLLSLRNEENSHLESGDVVKVLDPEGNVLEYGYLLTSPYLDKSNGNLIFVDVVLQSTKETIKMVLSNAIQKI